MRITIPKADYQKFYASLNFNNSYYIYDIVCDAVIRTYHFELRDVAKYLRLAKVATHKATRGKEYGFFNDLLSSNETFGTADEDQTQVSLEEKIKEMFSS